ncbi:MAG: potassium-transporting ATPase subunit KdpA [Propionibacteriaceae bacterium]|nr:potassium-transporting ATPase subunit KdpA [Propionibacteriaceae bacterium]
MQWVWAITSVATVAIALIVVYRPLGDYMAWVFSSTKDWKVERAIYRIIGVDSHSEQSWQAYLRAVLVFSCVGMLLLYAMQRLQPWLPYSLGLGSISPDLAFNTAASFVGNTNWQAYSPESTVGYTVQMAGLSVQCFVSSAVGLAVAIALVRGLARKGATTIGNFWVDLVRANLRILLPLSAVAALVLIAGGTIQNLTGFTDITTIAGQLQTLPNGPVATQEAIKMLGTNGGGFYNANSAHPFENPTAWTNLFQVFLLLVIPFASPRTFGKMVGDHRLGSAILATMITLFLAAYAALTAFEYQGLGTAPQLAGGAMEGKEVRFGIVGSTLFTAATTGTTGGATNSTLDSYTAMGGMVSLLHMILGEVSPGGVGSGLYTILIMAVIAVFIVGLLLGRTPVMLGKRIGVREIKLASLAILVIPVLSLAGMAISFAIPAIHHELVNQVMGNSGPHGLTETTYAFVSATINNGSSFAGFGANTPWLNVVLGLLILLGRFLVIAIVLAMAGSFAAQDQIPTGVGELPLHSPQFVAFFVALIIFVAVPTFFAVLAAGPFAEGLG